MIVTGVLYLLPALVLLAAGADGNLSSGKAPQKENTKPLQGDVSDGSRAVPVHLIDLIDEQGQKILSEDERFLPFSTRQTCAGDDCHNVQTVAGGWHFNAVDGNVPAGRLGQPWIFVDARSGAAIPLSYRPWPGAFRPQQIGLSAFQFTQLFGRQLPGGGPGELESDNPDEVIRGFVSGKLEINCLCCHSANPAQDQAEYADQTARQNFRWAATAASGLASVRGSAATQPNTYDYLMSDAIAVKYRENIFDHKNRVFFDIVTKIRAERCYFCHSNADLDKDGSEKWAADEDVHLAAGLFCVDCHRNGIDHNITRGYENEVFVSKNPLAATSSCRLCHLGWGMETTNQELATQQQPLSPPIEGRLGAPVPQHRGIPLAHFDKLTCTACHSGPWPAKKTLRTKTSRAHGLGTHNINKSDDVLPHIQTVVFAKQPDGKIAPHKLIWPAFWATVKGQTITPIDFETVRRSTYKVIRKKDVPDSGGWPELTAEKIKKILQSLSRSKSIEDEVVYICGGKLWRLDKQGELIAAEHDAARPYLWPIAHDVRPAARSLGINGCKDCHSTKAPFFFGDVVVDSPVVGEQGGVKKMFEFLEVRPFYTRAFAWSFVFRPWLKVVALGSCALLAAVLLLYALKALACITGTLAGKD